MSSANLRKQMMTLVTELRTIRVNTGTMGLNPSSTLAKCLLNIVVRLLDDHLMGSFDFDSDNTYIASENPSIPSKTPNVKNHIQGKEF